MPQPTGTEPMPEDAIAAAETVDYVIPAGVYAETVTEVKHYTDRLFKFRITRPAAFRFRSGEFVMIGLPGSAKPVYRAYSIASPSWDEEIEFFSIKVPDGPLTSELQKIEPGDIVLMRKKPTGTLVLDALTPGKRLYMFSTGTGIAPFASLIRDPETYEKFERVILTHTCRECAELTYGLELVEAVKDDPLVGEEAAAKLIHVTSTTREDSALTGRITTLIEDGRLFEAVGAPPLDPATDRVMICGSMDMLKDVKALTEKAGLTEGSNSKPGEFVVERAFVD
jgi:ferredoxin--NADP+ reductase